MIKARAFLLPPLLGRFPGVQQFGLHPARNQTPYCSAKACSKKLLLLMLLLWAGLPSRSQEGVLPIVPVNKQRVQVIAAMLPEKPCGFGDPIQQRQRWNELYRSGQFASLLREADSLAELPFPRLTEQIYFSYYGGTDSETSKQHIMQRRIWLAKLVWAECLTNKGKYLPAIVTALQDIVSNNSWSFPAEDRNRTNYEGTLYTIGLSSSTYGLEVAQTLYLLEQRLPADLKKQLLEKLWTNVFKPVLTAVQNKDSLQQFTSLTNTGNYNPVTLANVTGAALAVITDRKMRAEFVAIAERYSNNYLSGFSSDGYCSEGVMYFNYGFGYYAMLREQLWRASAGKIDLLNRPKVPKAALYIPGIEIINGVFPAIADSEQDPKADRMLMYYLDRNLGLGLGYDTVAYHNLQRFSLAGLLYFFTNTASVAQKTMIRRPRAMRHYFDKAGVLVLRPANSQEVSMAAVLKGGHNAEHHNHNDLGSFSIVAGNELLMGDVGAATYTPKYFTSERYRLFKTAASYGHAVPLVNNLQQAAGRQAEAKIIQTFFNDKRDVFVMDLTSAYPDPSLSKLQRSFTFSREGTGSLIVCDTFSFTKPGYFETALVTRHPWRKISNNELEIIGKTQKLTVRLQAAEGNFFIQSEGINEGPSPYTRIAIRLADRTASGRVQMSIETNTL